MKELEVVAGIIVCGVNVNEKVYHLTLNLFTTLTAN